MVPSRAAVDDRVVYVAVGLLMIGVFGIGVAILTGGAGDARIQPAFVAGFVLFVAIYFVSMYVARYF